MNGQQLTSAIRKLGMTQKQFAQYVGVNERTIRRQQRGDSRVPKSTALLVENLMRAKSGNGRRQT